MITIVDYGSGNISAIRNIYANLKIPYTVSKDPKEIQNAEKLLLPGVGSFDFNIQKLVDSGLKDSLDQSVLVKKTPILGICVGLQIMAESSEEGKLNGLGWIKGHVKKFDENKIPSKPKTPHMGWNSIQVHNKPELFKNIENEIGFYFIHSYYIEVEDRNNILTTTFYGDNFVSGIHRDNIFAVQFHPEKSHHNGIHLLKNFSDLKC